MLEVLSHTSALFDGAPAANNASERQLMFASILSHVSIALRQNKDVGKSILKLSVSSSPGASLPPIKFMSMTPFRVALLLLVASTVSASGRGAG
jgi:hypothetical protein